MKENYTKWLNQILGKQIEGGYVNDPKDPGGPTNHGVTQRVYNSWRLKNGLKAQGVQNCTVEEASKIFENLYWDVVKADELPEPLDLIAFDCAINQGPGDCLKMLVNVSQVEDIEEKCKKMMQLRKDDYDQCSPTLKQRFYHGWMNRLDYIWKLTGFEGDWRS